MEIEVLLQEVVEEVKRVEGVRAIVLGGSRARGTSTPSSDIDLGIYYHPDSPLNINQLSQVATRLDDRHHLDLVTEPGGWGPWINGGGWLNIHSYPVDFLYRDLERVTAIIDECLNGKVDIFYQPGHPNGFVSSIYFAEVAVCQPLWDCDGRVLELRSKVQPYPDSLQRALIQKFAWEIDFSLAISKKSIERTDVTYAAGCCFRSAMCILQVLFAINKTHWLNEKGALAIADIFTVKPAMLKSRIEESFRLLEVDAHSIQKAIATLQDLSKDVGALMKDA